jgi:protein-tyrosine phosphatase
MVDIHCHILPGIDDGSDSWETTLEMCRIAADDGITHIVATPHANEEFMYSRNGHGKLLSELQARVPSLKFTLGCDFHMSYENIEDALLDPAPFAIGDTKYILVEFNNFSPPQQMNTSMFRLRSGDLVPIVTHPERNPQLQRNLQTVVQWAASGAVIQVTAGAFLGKWGSTAQRAAEYLLAHRAVHVIATDAHETRRRKPKMAEARKAIARLTSDEIASQLAVSNPSAIVAGHTLPYAPKPKL